MNRFIRTVKNNIIPSIVALVFLVACGVAFYLYHPASPYHERYTFVVRYEAIGTLSPGNRVEVRGISKGQITKVELTEDAVYVTAEVLADTKIARNSEFRLINSGLMGEREMCILTGESADYISAGDTVMGHYDEGTSGVSKNLGEALESLDEITAMLKAAKDSIVDGSIGKRFNRVVRKGENLIGTTKSMVGEWKSETMSILDKLDGNLNSAKELLTKVQERGGKTVDDVDALLKRVDGLLDQVKAIKADLDGVAAKLDQDDNTVGLMLTKNGELSKKMEKITADVDALVADLKKNGIKLNIDIF